MKLKPIFAALMSLVMLTACNTSNGSVHVPEQIVDPFDTTSTATVESNESDITPEKTPSEKAREAMAALNKNSMQTFAKVNGSEKDTFDYNGGEINITLDVDFINKADIKPELMTLGISVTLNGIHQSISVNGCEETEMHIQEFHYDTKTGGPWDGKATLDISFEPIIAEADKDNEQLVLAVVTSNNPHYRVSPDYPSVANQHCYATANNRICNVKTPITNYSDKTAGTGFEKELVTDEIKKKYSGVRSSYDSTLSTIFDDGMKENIFLTEDGKAEVGVLFTAKMSSTYRVYYLINGAPAKLADGTDYIEVEAEPGYIYSLAPVEISGAGLYDTVNAIALPCLGEDSQLEIAVSTFPSVIRSTED